MTDTERPRSQVNVSKHKDGYEATYTKYFETQQEAADWGDEMQNNDDQEQNAPDTAGKAEIDKDMQHDIDKGFAGQDPDQYKDDDKLEDVPSPEQPQNQPENMG